MTVFDILRFPNIDIYNREEMDQLPRELVKEWAAKICMDLEFKVKINHDISNSNLVWDVISSRVSKNAEYSSQSTKETLRAYYKKQYTALLKKMLGEYDSPV